MGQQELLGLWKQRGRWTLLIVPVTPRDSEDEEEEKWVDMAREEAALKDEAQELMFLHAIHPACLAAQQIGQDTLEPHCCKVTVVERIAALHKVVPELLDAMLGNLLIESPDTARLHYILEVFGKFFLKGQRRLFLWTGVLAIHDPLLHVSQAGLVLAYSLLGEGQQLMGDKDEDQQLMFLHATHPMCLTVFVSDPAKDISQQAREGIYWLYQLLLHLRAEAELGIFNSKSMLPYDWCQRQELVATIGL
ncbi:unnamed protein product [Caretta caretta]